MIPVSVPSLGFFVILFFSFATAITLLGSAIVLALRKPARAWFNRHKGSGFSLFALLGVFSLPFLLYSFAYGWFTYEEHAKSAADEAAKHRTLDHVTSIKGFQFPAGTRLTLLNPDGNIQYLEKAVFPGPQTIYGIEATAVFFSSKYHVGNEFAEKSPPAGQVVTLQGTHDQKVEDWICDATQFIGFTAGMDGKLQHFDGCTLGNGNHVGNLSIPRGTTLTSRASRQDMVVPAAWRLDVSSRPIVVTVGTLQLPLRDAQLMLNPQRALLAISPGTGNYATLTRETTIGPVTYASDTAIRSAIAREQRKWPGVAWIVSPLHANAHYAGHGDVVPGMSVLHASDGSVISVLSNEQAGVIIWQEISSGE
ncbi:hypothetical protein ACV229_10910 [Burkholderia sp. MR1-5-21]